MNRRTRGRNSEIAALRRHLSAVEQDLDREYTSARIYYEADLHHWIVAHLQRRLGTRWIVGSKHTIDGVRPDVVVYRVTSQAKRLEFLREERPWRMLVGVMEIKYRSSLADDLGKLARLQRRYVRANRKPLLAWMMFGDHFRADVHRAYYKGQLGRAAAIESWVAEQPATRGMSILRVGVARARDSKRRKAIRSALNRWFWIRDDAQE